MYLFKQLLYRLAISLRMFQEKGLRAGFVELGHALLRIFYQRGEYIVIINVLSDQIPLPDTKPGLVIRQVTTLEELASLRPITDSADMARFYRMFEHGSIAFIALHNEMPVGCCWISAEIDRRANRVQPPLRPGDACVHDLFVSPEYRSEGIGRTLIAHRLRFLREHGYKRAIGAVLKDNAPALKVNQKTGHIHIGEMSHTRILFWDSFNYNLPDAWKENGDVQAIVSTDENDPAARIPESQVSKRTGAEPMVKSRRTPAS
jgi:GNAT superfamily N-acetyltransferase